MAARNASPSILFRQVAKVFNGRFVMVAAVVLATNVHAADINRQPPLIDLLLVFGTSCP